MAFTLGIEIPSGGFDAPRRDLRRLAEQLALDVSDRAATRAKNAIRSDMAGAKLGKLGQAVDATSDKAKGRGVNRDGDVVRASGIVYIRSKSPRTVGAIISYTEGADILPVKGRWLWFPTDNAQRVVGTGKNRTRLTPALWKERGLDRKIGPLIRLKSVNGNPILAVKSVGVSAVGARGGRPRRLLKSGRPSKGDRVAELVVMFIGIPRTSRQARIDVTARAAEAVEQAVRELRGV